MKALNHLSFGLIFGSDTGNTEEVGDKICDELAVFGIEVTQHDIREVTPSTFGIYDVLILGIPTWDFGGIQEDWEVFESQLETMKLGGKIVALYGLGDQFGYGDYFLDAMGWLYKHVVAAGALVIGEWPTEGYDFEESLAINNEKTHFCGLAIDEDQQIELTDKRVNQWVTQIATELNAIMSDVKHA